MNRITRATYATMPALIATKTPFVHGSCRGEWLTAKDGTKIYRVFSYSTLIAQALNGSYWVDDRKFSVTTSRLQNIIRKAWSI